VAECARRVRAIDPKHAIIIEPALGGGAGGLDWLEPVDVPGVVYSFHFYDPMTFTHQGVFSDRVGVVYPGQIDGQQWDKERLRRAMKPAIDWQKDYGRQLYLGEFSAIRWAPGDSGLRWLTDVIDLAEEYGWDWTYHAYREWDGWSVEHGPLRADTKPSPTPTARQQLLCGWFAKNVKPNWGP